MRGKWIGLATIILVFVAVGVVFVAILSTRKSAESLKVGAVLPLTGSAAVWGQNAKMGMDLAVDQINSGGGVNGKRLVVIYEDSQSDPKLATSALQKLISADGIQVVIGDIASSSVLAMAPIAERNHIVLLSPGASNPEISHAGRYIFRNWQSDALEGEVDARFAYDKLKWRRVALLHVNNAYGTGLADVFKRVFTNLGGSVLREEFFEQSATDMRTQITKIAATKPDGIYMPGYPPEMATALKQMRELAVTLPILSVQAFDDPEILKRAGDAAEGVIFSVPTPPDPKQPVVSAFHSQYAQMYHKEPGVCSDTGYDAVRIVAWAIGQGASTGAQIREKMAALNDFPGAAGKTTFDANGDVVRDFSFFKVKDGKFQPTEASK
jgi:branched-chain amino acid transport system substrate-binding protein